MYRHLGCFQYLVIINNAAINNLLYFWRCMFSGIARAKSKCICSFFRYHQIPFQIGCTKFAFPSALYVSTCFPLVSPAEYVVMLFNFCRSNRWLMVSQCRLHCSNYEWVWTSYLKFKKHFYFIYLFILTVYSRLFSHFPTRFLLLSLSLNF